MNNDMPNARFYVTAALIVLGTAWVLISYARAIRCTWCRHPYAIWPRECGELCRSCSRIYERSRHSDRSPKTAVAAK
jgi:hypothetical protein